MKRWNALLLSVLLVASMVACTGQPVDDSASSHAPEASATLTGGSGVDPVAQPVIIAIDPTRETRASFAGFTLTLPVGSTEDGGALTVQPASSALDLNIPALRLTNGLAVSVAGTRLTGEATISRDIALSADSKDVPVVIWEKEGGQGAEMLPAKVDRHGNSATVTATTTHFSQGWFGTLDVKALTDSSLNEVKGLFVGRSNVEQPQCEGADLLRKTVDIRSDEGDSIKWCAGRSNGKAFVSIANNRRTFTQVEIPRDWSLRASKQGFSVDALIRTVGTGLQTFNDSFPKYTSIVLVKAGETLTFDAPSGPPTRTLIRTRLSTMGYGLQILSQAIDMYSGMGRRLVGGQKFDKYAAWTGNWFEEIQRGVPAKDSPLITAWASCFRSFTDNVTDQLWDTPKPDDLGKLGPVVADCVDAIAKAGVEDVGPAGPMTAVISTISGVVGTVWGLTNLLSASLRGIWDEVTSVTKTGGSSYSIGMRPKEVVVDLMNATIPAGSCYDDVHKSGWPGTLPIPLKNGKGWVGSEEAGWVNSIMDTRVLGQVDLDGDGTQEIVAMLQCSGTAPEWCCSGRTSVEWVIGVFRQQGTRLVRVATPYLGGLTYPGDQYGPLGRVVDQGRLEGTTLVTSERIAYPETVTEQEAGGDPDRLFIVRLKLKSRQWVPN